MSSSEREISVGDLTEMVKGFMDILILASGYQSAGLVALWDSSNIKNAFKWALLLENVLRHLNSSPDYQELIAELDNRLSEMTAHLTIPQALYGLSSNTFTGARALLAEHMIQALPLRDEHLIQLMMAITEMDLDELQGNELDDLNLYLDKLMHLSSSFFIVQDRKLAIISPDSVKNMEVESCTPSGTTELAVKELLKRQSAVSFLLRAETGLDIVEASVSSSDSNKGNCGFYEKQVNKAISAVCEDLVDYGIWSHWRSKNLSYFLNKRTIRLVSGASLIFSATKEQWTQVFKQLNISSAIEEDNLLETIEIMLLGCISSRWGPIIQSLSLLSDNFGSISKQIQELYDLLRGRSPSLLLVQEAVNSKEKKILLFLVEKLGLGTLASLLWKVSPALVAAAIPSGSPLFKLYVTEIENQLKQYSTIRRCTCTQDRREHIHCALAERIWCLNIFHVHGGNSISMHGSGTILPLIG